MRGCFRRCARERSLRQSCIGAAGRSSFWLIGDAGTPYIQAAVVFGSIMAKKRLLYISAVIPKCTGGGSEMRAGSHIMVLSELFDTTLAIIGNHGREVEVHRGL